MSYNFFAYMARMKLIRRWSLMKCVDDENIAEHSAQVAQIAHALALIKNKMFGGNLDANRIATAALKSAMIFPALRISEPPVLRTSSSELMNPESSAFTSSTLRQTEEHRADKV